MWGRQLARMLAGLLLLAGCSAGGEVVQEATSEAGPATLPTSEPPADTPSPTQSPPPTSTPDAEPKVEAYMHAHVSNDPEEMADARATAVPDSPADAYLTYVMSAVRSNAQAGYEGSPAGQLEDLGDGSYESCKAGNCLTFDDFEFDDQGRVRTFAVNGNPIGERIAGTQSPQQVGPVTVTPLVGYRNSEESLTVLIEFVNDSGESVEPVVSLGEYVTPDGEQVAAQMAQGANPLRAGASTIAGMEFGDVPLGGTVYVPVYDADNTEHELSFTLTAAGS